MKNTFKCSKRLLSSKDSQVVLLPQYNPGLHQDKKSLRTLSNIADRRYSENTKKKIQKT